MADAIVAHPENRPTISRDEAISAGLKRYFTGLPCVKGHISERNVGRRNECLECKRNADKEYAATRKTQKAEYDRQYRDKNIVRIAESKRIYRQQQDADAVREYQAAYRKANAERLREYREENIERRRHVKREWDAKNKDHVTIYSRTYASTKLATDEAYRLAAKLRQRLAVAVRSGAKAGSAVRDLGCTIDDLKKYLEAQFSPGMTWQNWGRKGWHIDHKKPLAAFDLTDPEQAKEACHYTNLQPLWYRDNLSKGARLDWRAADRKAA